MFSVIAKKQRDYANGNSTIYIVSNESLGRKKL